MPVDFIQDTSVQNSILYAYTTGYNNQPINSNILFNVLTPYDRITDRNTAISTALTSYSTTTQMNSSIGSALTPYSTTTQMSSSIGSALTPYSTTTQMNSSISTALSPYSTTTQMNSSIDSALTPYALTTSLSAKQNTLIASTTILGIGSNITALNYNNISNPPSLSQYALSTDVLLGLSAKQNTLIASTTILGIGSNITALNYNNISNPPTLSQYALSTDVSLGLSAKQNTLISSTTILGIGSNITALNYNNISNPPNLSLYATTATLGSYSTTTQMNSSISTALTPYSTTAQMNSSISTALTPYALTTSLSAKQNTLTASTTILGIGSNITAINYNNIYNPPSLSQYALSTDLTGKQNTLTASTTILGIGSSITALNYNNISNPPSLNFLPLSGGNLSGNVTNTNSISVGTTNISSKLTVNNIVSDRNSYDHSLSPMTITHQTPTSSTVLNDPQPILHLCRQSTSGQTYGARGTISLCRYENNGGNSRTRMDISLAHNFYDNINILSCLSSGYVGIGTTAPSAFLHISETTGTAAGANNGSIILDHENSGGVSSIIFRSKINRGSDFGYIQYNDNLGSGENGKLIIGTQNDADDDILLLPSGKVGIGTAFPQTLLDVNGTINATALNSSGVISANGDSLVFPNTLKDLKISLYSGWGFGIQSGELKYIGGGNHKFYNGVTNTFTIDGSGNTSCIGTISCSTINASGMTFNDSSYINYPNYLYFKNTTANKTITMSAGNLNVPENINVSGYINLSTTFSYLTFADKWKIGVATANGVTNSLIFSHVDTGINSYWWLSGTQTATQSDISDERIKKEIKPINDGLNKLMKLKPKEYYLCDDRDYNKKYGVIAQDVEIDFPELIFTDTEYIANIYSYATYDNFIITFDKDITDLIQLDDELKIVLDNNDKNNLEIVLDDTPYNNRYKKRYCKVIEIVDNYSFKIDIELKEENVFVFGKKVNDFKKLDYQSLYCLNISATQELYKIIKELQARIEVLENIA